MKELISTKNQNTILGIILAFAIALVCLKSYMDISNSKKTIINQEYSKLSKSTGRLAETFNKHFDAYFESIGELFYDNDIKKAVLMRKSSSNNEFNKLAYRSLRKFAIYKKIDDIFVFDNDYNLMTKVNRGLKVDSNTLDLIQRRLIDYRKKQIIFQNMGNTPVFIFILRLSYSNNNNAYVVVIKDLQNFIGEVPNYECKQSEFFIFSRTLDYKNFFMGLKGDNSLDYFSLQEDTLLKYNFLGAQSFNLKGQETESKLVEIDNLQHCFMLGMLKPEYIDEQVQNYRKELKEKYTVKFFTLLMLFIAYLILLLSKINIEHKVKSLASKIIKLFYDKDENEDKEFIKELAKRTKEEAFAYLSENNNVSSIQNSMFNFYKTLKKLSPEDVANLSIKNSLSKENIRLVYQPAYGSKTMLPEYCEVYLRLLNYYGEELMPSEFIPVLKHFNMLENLDEMMLEKVIFKIKSLQSKNPQAKIALNISRGAFVSKKFKARLQTELLSGNIQTSNVTLEIPSFDLVQDEASKDFINNLFSKGVQFTISIKDFDDSKIKTILDNNIKHVKIDMMYLADVLENPAKQKNLKNILDFCKDNDILITAEKIETELMFKLALSLDVDYLQGFYISRPKRYFTHK